jgi:hypothetical protein
MFSDYLLSANILLLTKDFIVEILYLILRLFGIKNYNTQITVKDDPMISVLTKGFYTRIQGEGKPFGLLLGKNYIGYGHKLYIEKHGQNMYEYIFYFLNKDQDIFNCRKDISKFITSTRDQIYKCDKDFLTPRKVQNKIIKRIINVYKKRSHTVVVILGETGIGKSKVSDLLAQQMGCYLHQTEILSDSCSNPSSNINYVYNYFPPTTDKPIVFICDEFENIIKCNKYGETTIRKREWNIFFDNIDSGYYPHVIIILTSNQKKEYFDDICPSLLRKGRIDLICEMSKESVKFL